MKTELKLSQALPLAEKIKDALSPACERIEVAGSIRRRKATVGDIEIVAIPKLIPDMAAQLSLFGDPPMMVSALDMLLERLTRDKPNFTRGDKNGELQKQFYVLLNPEDGAKIMLELWLASPENWGYIFALRTGPAEFNKAWVTQQRKGGLLPNRYSGSGGRLHKDGKPIPTPEESDVFDLIGGLIPPTDRDQWEKYYK